jgi:hypothetical protein
LVTHFVQEAASPTTLAAMMAGGLAYRFGRIGILATGADLTGNTATLLRGLSVVGGLSAEVSTFELVNRSFQGLLGDRSNPNLWNFRGQGGILQGLASSTITFGLLKGAGHLGREQNLVFQHAFQSSSMVLGHQVGATLGLTPRPEGTLAEQLLTRRSQSSTRRGDEPRAYDVPRYCGTRTGFGFVDQAQNLRATGRSPLQDPSPALAMEEFEKRKF